MSGQTLGGGAPSSQVQSEFSLVALLATFVVFRKLIVGVALVAGIVNGFLVWRSPRTYTSSASVISENRGTPVSISIPGFGGLGAGDPTQSAAFYANLATSEAVLRKVIETPVTVGAQDGSSRSVRLVELMGGQGTAAKRRRAAMDAIEGMVDAKVELGAIELEAKASDPVVARDIVAGVIEAMNRVNSERRRGSASRERAFAEERIRESLAALRDAEEAQAQFLRTNREWRSSPSLTLANDRLFREVNRLAQVYLTRSQAFDQVRLEEVRDLPVLSVLSAPEVASEPDPRGLGRALGLGASVGFAATLVLITLVELFRRVAAQDSPDVSLLRAEVASATEGMRRWIRRIVPSGGGRSR